MRTRDKKKLQKALRLVEAVRKFECPGPETAEFGIETSSGILQSIELLIVQAIDKDFDLNYIRRSIAG